MALSPQQQSTLSGIKKKAEAVQSSLNKSVASGQIKSTPKGQVLGASTDSPAGSLKDLSIALAPQNLSSGGSIKDLSIGLAKGNKITQDDITRAQSGGASLASLSAPVSPSTGMSSPSTSPTQTSNQTGVSGGKKGYYSRYGGKEEPVVETPSYEEIQKQMMKDAQKQVNSLHKYEQSLLAEQQTINQQNDRSTQSVNVLSGLAGSSEANIQQQKTTAQGQQANKQIMDAVNVQVQSVLANVRKDAQDAYRFERTQANADQTTRDAHAKVMRDNAIQNVSALAGSGATAEGYKATDPEGYAHLAQTVGGEDVLKGMFTLNRPVETIVDKQLVGGKYIIAYQNPLDGKTRVETVDLGLPPQYTKTIDAGNRILAVPDDWDGDPSKLVTINKGLTPSQAAAGGGGTGSSSAYGSDLDAIIGATKATITSKFGQNTFDEQMARARNEGDKINLVASVVLGKADSATKTDFTNQAVGINQIDKAIKMLDEGTKTGVLQAGAQYAYNVVGKDFDPKLAQINQLITSAIQPYRNSVTGAAWGNQEDGEYQMLFGSTRYSPAELKQRLQGVKEILASKSATALNSYVNPMNYYDNPFDQSGGAGGDIESQKQELRSQGYSEEQIDQLMNS